MIEWFSPQGYLDGSGSLLDKDEIDVYQYIDDEDGTAAGGGAGEAAAVVIHCPVARFAQSVQRMCTEITARGDPKHQIFWTSKSGRIESMDKPSPQGPSSGESTGGGAAAGGGAAVGATAKALTVQKAMKRAQMSRKKKPMSDAMIAQKQAVQDKEDFMEVRDRNLVIKINKTVHFETVLARSTGGELYDSSASLCPLHINIPLGAVRVVARCSLLLLTVPAPRR